MLIFNKNSYSEIGRKFCEISDNFMVDSYEKVLKISWINSEFILKY